MVKELKMQAYRFNFHKKKKKQTIFRVSVNNEVIFLKI